LGRSLRGLVLNRSRNGYTHGAGDESALRGDEAKGDDWNVCVRERRAAGWELGRRRGRCLDGPGDSSDSRISSSSSSSSSRSLRPKRFRIDPCMDNQTLTLFSPCVVVKAATQA